MTWEGAWPTHVLTESRRRLHDLVREINTLADSTNPEIDQAMSRFLVVRSCGHLEFTFEEALCSFAEARSNPQVADFVRSTFFRGSNPTPRRLVETLERMDKAGADGLRELLDDDDQRLNRELSFLVDRRNKIAHGQSENVRRRKALDLADVSLEVSDWVVAALDPL